MENRQDKKRKLKELLTDLLEDSSKYFSPFYFSVFAGRRFSEPRPRDNTSTHRTCLSRPPPTQFSTEILDGILDNKHFITS